MWIIGVDYHPSVQQIAFVNTDTGECGERRLHHSEGEAEKFYRELKAVGCSVRVGMEASGYARWFERRLASSWFTQPPQRGGRCLGPYRQVRHGTELVRSTYVMLAHLR